MLDAMFASAANGTGKMGLSVISGPPGSGREELILGRFETAIAADPVLVAPTRDDVGRLERELCRRAGSALLGGSVTTLPGLFGEVRRAAGVEAGPAVSRMQRVWLARAAARETDLRRLRRSAAREGFAPALEALLADLQAAGLDAAALDAAIETLPEPAYEREIGALFATYERLREEAGLTDEGTLGAAAVAALRAEPASWLERPVLLLGFDDLTRQQVELVAALAAAAPVTVAINFEPGRPALAARATLRGVLVDELGATAEPPLERAAATGTLRHLERNLFEPDPAAIEPEPGALELIEGAGERSEAELIGRAVARLLADGVDPDEIAVAVRSPDRQAPLLARVLSGLGIPVAAEARVPLSATATGAALLRLLAIAGPDGSAADVVAFLRGPARARPDAVDWLERATLRGRMSGAAEALTTWGHRVWELEAIGAANDGAALAAEVGRIAADLAERPHLRSGFTPSAGPGVELRAAAEVGRALREAAALGRHAPTAGQLAELLGHVRVPLWGGGAEGRVRILSPYRLRAARLQHLFVAGLADGSFPAGAPADPLLADERRAALGLPPRSDPAAEERYLFHACVARPEAGLHLCYAAGEESGKPKPRSPYVDEVRALLAPPPTPDPADDPLEAVLTTRAEPGDVVAEPAAATSERDLARALAARDGSEPTGVPAEVAARVGAGLARARAALAAAASPGPLSDGEVLATLAAERLYGASTLEGYDGCSYRWFVGHELAPRPLGPDPEVLEDGGLAHAVLERLYGERPGGGARPRPGDVGDWIEAARGFARDEAEQRGWDPGSAQARIRLARAGALIARFLRREAATGGGLEPDRDLLEVGFGVSEGDRFGPAALDGFELHGRIDRIDVAGPQALIRDYKLSPSAPAASKLLKEGRLQMPLYVLAARGFGLDPVGGLYSPLAASGEDRPRGLLRSECKGDPLPAEKDDAVRTDFLPDEEFEALLEAAAARAAEIVADMRGGRIDRDPRDGDCPSYCTLAPICRIERVAVAEDPEADVEEAAAA